ncbi:MAG: hypothetical protein WBB31_08210 [Saprospiraceae bacterium]
MKQPIRSQGKFNITFFFFLLLNSNMLLGQAELFLNFQSTSLDFPSLSEKDIQYSNQFILQITNPKQGDENIYNLKLEIQGNGISMTSLGRPGSGISFKFASQITFFSSDLAHFFDFDELEISGISREQYQLHGLPEGIYTVCFTAIDNTYDRNQSASNQACINLLVRENLPPEIIRPYNEEVFSKNDQYLFQWMPRHISSGLVNYNFLVFEAQEGFTDQELLYHFRPIINESTFGFQYTYYVSSKILKPGKKYVAFVQAQAPYNNFIFKNAGYSDPIRFELDKTVISNTRMQENEAPEPNCLYPVSDVIINEFNYGLEGGRGVFIELLVTGIQSGQDEIDLDGWIIDDNNYFQSNPNANSGHIRLGTCFSDIPRGSLILIYDNNYLNAGINPAMDGMPNANGVYQICLTNACLSVTQNCPSDTDSHYSCTPQSTGATSWPTYASFQSSGDLIQLRRPDGDIEHAFLWNTDNYEFISSEKVIDFNTVNFATGLGLAFTTGNNWYNAQGFSVINSSQASPGTGNSSANTDLINNLKAITSYNPFYITCRQEILGNSSWAIIDLFGYTASSSFRVIVDGVPVITYSVNNPIQVPLHGAGYHIIDVVDSYNGCHDEGIVEVPTVCVPGTPCNDLNSCTSSDVLDAHCNCAGTPDDEVTFTVSLANLKNCDYCISLVPTDYDPYIDYFIIESITLVLPTGGTVYLNELDNLDDDRRQIFNFPYCIGCQGNNGITLLMNDFNAWLVANGFIGNVSIGTSPCGAYSLIFTNTNISLLSAEATTNIGDPFEINFHESDCSQLPTTFGYNVSASLENCGELSPENENEVVSWIWSTGSSENYLFTPNQEDCYAVSVTCSTGCTYVGVFPQGGDCGCIVGNPCILAGNDPAECRTGTLDQNCHCVLNPVPDSDNDSVCDLADQCPGFNDLEDSDHDGVPDGCDLCYDPTYPPHVLTAVDSMHLLDNDPENDPVFCLGYPCNEDVSIGVTSLGQPTCDYCLRVDGTTTFPNDPYRYFKSASFIINGQPAQLDLMTAWENYNTEGFEIDWGSWNSGGSDAIRHPDVVLANTGKYSVELKSSGVSASMSTDPFSLSSCCQIRIDFSYRTKDFQGSSESFILEKSTNNGSSYSSVKEYFYNTDFQNELRYNETVYINGPFSSVTKFRLRCIASNSSHKIYFDDIIIHRISNTGYGCFSTDDDRPQFAHIVQNWLYNQLEYLDFLYVTGNSNLCGSGDFFQVSNTDVAFQSISILGNGQFGNYHFTSPDCGNLLPGQESFVLKAESTCIESTYKWSTGQTTSSIVVPYEDAGYQVTITCEDGCSYVVEYGNQNCLVGTPCTRPGDLCNPTGVIDAYCNCYVEEPNTIDTNGNGIPDCKEESCNCNTEPEIIYTPAAPQDRCNFCIPLDGVNDLVIGVKISTSEETIILDCPGDLEYQYCIGNGGSADCDSDTIKPLEQFKSDFYRWSLLHGYNLRVLLETDSVLNCGLGYFLRIENAPFKDISLILENDQLNSLSNPTCSVVSTGYSVSLSTVDCAVCSHPSYHWSDGSTGPTPLAEIVSSPNIGYTVTVTCSDNCSYEIESPGDILCIVGTPCDDANSCTHGDVYDEQCHCAGVIDDENDSDGDGVANSCDRCEGFNDTDDDDADTVPNGCDCHPGQNDLDPNVTGPCEACSYADGQSPYMVRIYMSVLNMTSPNWCGIGSNYIRGFSYCGPEEIDPVSPHQCASSLWVEFKLEPNFKLGYCVCPGVCTGVFYDIDDFTHDLQNWLRNVMHDDLAEVLIINNDLVIQHSIYRFDQLYLTDKLTNFFDGSYAGFDARYEDYVVEIGAPCDDGDPCTIYDRWDETCRCAGIFQDSDGDGVCNAEDQCPDQLDYIDFNQDGIPDCLQSQLVDCDGGISFCEFIKRQLEATYEKYIPPGIPNATEIVPLITNDDNLAGNSYPRVIQRKFKDVQDRLYIEFQSENWQPLNMNYPLLIENIRSKRDSDKDGIYDYFDPCPDKEREETGDYFTSADFSQCDCSDKTWENMVILYGLLFETVSYFNDPNSPCYDSEEQIILPGCAAALGIAVYMDDDCVLRASEGNCPIEFKVDCNGNCEAIYLGLHDGSNNCDAVVDVGAPCALTPADCPTPGPCQVYVIVGNPAYAQDPSQEPCMCQIINRPDADGDGICDDEDPCPTIDFVDNDQDGIDDCIDNCPDIPGMRGDPCDDNDPCTYADHIDENCHCTGVHIDLDDDGVYDCDPCTAAIDNDGDGYIDEVIMENGHPKCDVCPGLDDMVDEDQDGRPDCIFPPYKPIGCPTGFALIKKTGIVLIYDSDEILKKDLPEPISIWLIGTFTGASTSYEFYPYLTITSLRETSGTFEVLYGIKDLPSYIDPADIRIAGITYSNHQQCIMDDLDEDGNFDISTQTFVGLPCPSFSTFSDRIEFLFSVDPEFKIDPTSLIGDLTVNFTSSAGANIQQTFEISSTTVDIVPSGLMITGRDLVGLGATGTYSGDLNLPNGLTCHYNPGGALAFDCVEIINGANVYHTSGNPCDDGDPCTHHDKWQMLNGVCTCAGEASPDSDGDTVCDAIDPCPDIPNEVVNGVVQNCPCPELIIESSQIVNEKDLEIILNVSEASQFSHVDVSITGGPKDEQISGMSFTSPFIVPNLAYGYYYVITLHGVCLTGGTSDATVEIDVPFGEDQFICGINISDIDLSNFSMLPSLNRGDIFTAADFEINVGSTKGSNGKFTGLGYIKVPYLGQVRINVSFTDIIINADYQLVSGSIKVNGFGLALLGDDLSNSINDLVNKVLDPLISLDQMLEEISDMLELIDEYVETTKQLVSQETKDCLTNAKANLVALQQQQPPATEAELKAAAVEVQNCLTLYNQEIAAIMASISEVIQPLTEKIFQESCQTQLEDLRIAYEGSTSPFVEGVVNKPLDNYTSLYTAYINAHPLILNTELQSAGFITSDPFTKYYPIEPAEIPSTANSLQAEFYSKESAYHFCYLMDLIANPNSSEYMDTPEEIKILLKLLLEVGNQIVDDIQSMVKAGYTNEEIVNDPDKKIQLLLESYLKSSVQLRSYGNIRN